jgi:hypothetical protein
MRGDRQQGNVPGRYNVAEPHPLDYRAVARFIDSFEQQLTMPCLQIGNALFRYSISR